MTDEKQSQERIQAFVPTEDDRRIADRLRGRRRELQMRQADLAKQIGISTRTLNRYELLQRAIPRRQLDRMESLLGPLSSPGSVRYALANYGGKNEVPLSDVEQLLLRLFRYMGQMQRDKLLAQAFYYGRDVLKDTAAFTGQPQAVIEEALLPSREALMLRRDVIARLEKYERIEKQIDTEMREFGGADWGWPEPFFSRSELTAMALSGVVPPDWEARFAQWEKWSAERLAKWTEWKRAKMAAGEWPPKKGPPQWWIRQKKRELPPIEPGPPPRVEPPAPRPPARRKKKGA